ncbi:MAG: rhodanese-like domain-containing protein [Smithellaceae bacterium]|nr:rhodanese-like domain-containing protein [Smithellaceae bacterium]
MKKAIVFLLSAMLILTIGNTASASGVGNPARAADLRLLENIIGDEDWVLVDCRPKKAYDEGHIPLSITLGDTCAKVLLGADLKPKALGELEKILGKAGITAESNVIFYADTPNIPAAIAGIWVLGYLGHQTVQFFNVEAWIAGGLPVVKARTELDPVEYKAVRK